MILKLVNKIIETENTKSFYFEADENFVWQAGQYIYLTLGDITKQFTISSSPTEKIIQITTRVRKSSEYKQQLDNLEMGSKTEARGPFGSFTFNAVKNLNNHVFMAGGIGITPFRSMIKFSIDKNIKTPIFLIFSNSGPDFVFKKELDKWQKENSYIKIVFIDSIVSGHIDKQKIEVFMTNWNLNSKDCIFSAVGPPPFVNSMEDILDELKISQNQIKTEKFIGY